MHGTMVRIFLFLFSHLAFSNSLRSMNYSMQGLPVLHNLWEFAQTHVHWVSDAIQPSHPLSSPSPAFNLSQHQGLFQWVGFLHQVAKVLELQLQHQSFQWIFRVDYLAGLISLLLSDSQESSLTPQFKSINSLYLSFLYRATLTSIYYFSPSLIPCWVITTTKNTERIKSRKPAVLISSSTPELFSLKGALCFYQVKEHLILGWEICIPNPKQKTTPKLLTEWKKHSL